MNRLHVKINKLLIPIFVIFAASSMLQAEATFIHHDLTVEIKPAESFVRVEDQLTIPAHLVKKRLHFLLHGSLSIIKKPKNIHLKKERGELKKEYFGINTASFEIKKKIPLNHYSFKVPGKAGEPFTFSLVYEGTIHHPIEKIGAEYARGFSETPGIICEKGAYLAGSSFWVPWFNDELITFKLETVLPAGWSSVSQGKRTRHEKQGRVTRSTWDAPEPMSQVYLVAAPFSEYGSRVGDVDVLAFLRSPDEGLANKYLETTGQYLAMYEKLIGPFPFAKFALVENFWETGYGMASFTLLGEKVIRFPFILHSSYPHELLHNWWGNSVYVDYETGNWCEGLTTFLADQLIKEQRGQGAEYRKTSLQAYTDYAAGKKEEFPLSAFRSRYDALSSAIGYNKSMMIFNMLRLELGDRLFVDAIRHFYKENRFKRASFEDLKRAFETVSGKDLKAFFDQWLTRKGSPMIRLAGPKVSQKDGRFRLDFTLEQVQDGDSYTLKIPAAIFLADQKRAEVKYIEFKEKKQDFSITFASRPYRLIIDPQFDIFRLLHQDEIVPSLSRAFGAQKVLILLPGKAAKDFLKGYRELAESWASDNSGQIEVKMDHDVEKLPADRAVWLFGKENIHKGVVAEGILRYGAALDDEAFTVGNGQKKRTAFDSSSIVVTVKNPKNPDQVIVLLSADMTAALPGLGRKLPHYGKYSYLAFAGDEPANHLKGQFTPQDSPMSAKLAESKIEHSLPKREPLARLSPVFSEEKMMQHIRYLASEELEGRGLGSKGIAKAAEYIAKAFKTAGLVPAGSDGSYFQEWSAEAGKEKRRMELVNVIGMLPGTHPELKESFVVVCAHYDHLGLGWPDVHKGDEGKIHFGADDNASGAAVMLELAEQLAKQAKGLERSLLFIAFTGEESGLLGSTYYLENLEEKELKNIFAALNLDTVGRFAAGEKSKLLVLGGSSAREWRFIFMGIGYTTGIETELVTQELDASDQKSFIERGIPAVQLSSGPHLDYHRPGDTVEKIIPSGLVKVAAAAKEAIVYLAARKEPLTVTGSAAAKQPTEAAASKGSRRVSTGLMPDFSHSGIGVKIGAVSPGSPAQKAGLQKGDIIVKLGNRSINDLREYANLLKSYKPGDTVTFTYLRQGKERETKIKLQER